MSNYPKNRFLDQSSRSTLVKPDWDCTEVVFMRHGESFNNCIYEQVRDRFGDTLSHEEFEAEIDKLHDPDCGLSPKGMRQAQALRNHLRDHSLEMIRDIDRWNIYTSPMRRCLLTAQEVSRAFHNKTIFVHPRLFESDGCYQAQPDGSTVGIPGFSKAQVEEQFPHFHCLPGMENGWFHLPRKETRREFYERSLEIVEFLWSEHFRIHSSSSEKIVLGGNEDSVGSELDQQQIEVESSSEVTSSPTTASSPLPTSSSLPKQEGIMIVAHGNIIATAISYLLHTNALITSCNTGMSHVQLWTHKVTRQRMVSLVSTNRVPHFQQDPSLHGGERIFEDHWIQEFLAAEDF